ncbi:MAG: hypothetical protein ACREJU_05810 [Nitrospiraceae bacterium]
MPQGDKTKVIAFPLWLAGKTLAEIQAHISKKSGTTPEAVKGWVLDWERGKQNKWAPSIK